MSDAAGIRAQMSQVESQIDGCEICIADLQEKIAKLKEVKPKVAQIKENIVVMEIRLNESIWGQERWLGDNKNKYNEAASESLITPYQNYYDAVDDVLDSINDAITRMENGILEQQGLIGKLRAWWNSLCNELSNAFN